YLIAGDHFQLDRRRPGSTHLRIRRVHQQSSDSPTAHLWQDVEAVDMADPPSRPHEVRLIIKSDYKADGSTRVLGNERKRVGAGKPLAIHLPDDLGTRRLG